MKRVLITGASGYIGSSLAEFLLEEGYELMLASRTKSILSKFERVQNVPVLENFSSMRWANYLQNINTIIFCAGVAHLTKHQIKSAPNSYYDINVKAATNLASQAKSLGIKKFIYISTIGINGKQSKSEIDENSREYTHDSYTRSKLIAERALEKIFLDADVDLVIFRIPMVYGLNAPGNPRKALKLLLSGMAPVGGLRHNQRSFIFIENLKSAVHAVVQSQGKSGLFCVSDGFIYSTYSYFQMLALLNNITFKVIYIPISVFKFFRYLTKNPIIDSIIGDMAVSNQKFSNVFDWIAPYKTITEVKNSNTVKNCTSYKSGVKF